MRLFALLFLVLAGCAGKPMVQRGPASYATEQFAITWNNTSGNFGSCLSSQNAMECAVQDCAGDCNEMAYCRIEAGQRVAVLIRGVKHGTLPHYTNLVCLDQTREPLAPVIERALKDCEDQGYSCVEAVFPD